MTRTVSTKNSEDGEIIRKEVRVGSGTRLSLEQYGQPINFFQFFRPDCVRSANLGIEVITV